MHHGAFEEEEIKCRESGASRDSREYSLAAMRAEIAGVKQALSFRFDQKGVGIGSGVIDKIGSDGELTDGKRLPGLKSWKSSAYLSLPRNTCGGVDQAASQLADVDGVPGCSEAIRPKWSWCGWLPQGIHGKRRKVYGLNCRR